MLYLHQRKIIHKDLKPSNLIISKHRGLVIIDYEISSISRLYFKDEQVLTNILRFKGNTPHYMVEMFPEGFSNNNNKLQVKMMFQVSYCGSNLL